MRVAGVIFSHRINGGISTKVSMFLRRERETHRKVGFSFELSIHVEQSLSLSVRLTKE